MSKKMYIICSSGTHEKMQMAAMVASVAAVSDYETSVFFSMNAITHFVKGRATTPPIEGEFGELLVSKEGIPKFKDLFQQTAELGDAKLLPCSMALDVLGLSEKDLDMDFGEPTGLTKFLSDAEGEQLLTF